MCSGAMTLPLLGSALGVASNLASQYQSVKTGQEQYSRQLAENEISRRKADDEARVAREQAVLNYQQIRFQEQQANETAAVEKSAIAQEADKVRAQARLAIFENSSGAGNLMARAMADLGFSEAQQMNSVEIQRQNYIDQSEGEKQAAYLSSKTKNSYTVTPTAPKFNGLSFLNATLSGIQGYSTAGGTFTSTKKNKQVSQTSSIQYRGY